MAETVPHPSRYVVSARGQQGLVQQTRARAASAAGLLKMGRARTHGAHDMGTPERGARSFSLTVTALGDVLAENWN